MTDTKTSSPETKVAVTLEAIMGQAQVFASAYSIAWGPFYDGSKMQQSNDEKVKLERMIYASLTTRPASPDQLADKIEDLIAEFGSNPKAALECVSEYLQMRRQPIASLTLP